MMSIDFYRYIRLTVAAAILVATAAVGAQETGSTSRPLPPEYRINDDGSVTLRICFNWACNARQKVTFTASEMAGVAAQMAQCSTGSAHERLQRVRIGIWQLESLAQSRQPLLANDEPVNDRDASREGRMDCIDNSSNTTTYLSVLRDLGLLHGWSVDEPRVRDALSMDVHWTAVVVDSDSREPWAVDSWFRANGHLPFVLPLAAWKSGAIAWHPPFDAHNPYPRYSHEICSAAPALRMARHGTSPVQ